MLDPTDVHALTAWCKRRAMRWLALHADADATILLLEPVLATRPWQRMRLVAEAAGMRLEAETGDTLASASDLPALLDAVDGGVADRPSRPDPSLRPGASYGASIFV